MNGFLIVLALAITIMYVITQICDTIKEIFKNRGVNNENTKDIKKNNRKYKLIKIYKTYVLYEEVEVKYKECFMKHDLGLLKEQVKPDRKNSIFGGY